MPRKANVASLIRDYGTPNRCAAVGRSDCADRFRLPAAAGYGRRNLGSAASNCSVQRAGNQAAANRFGNTNLAGVALFNWRDALIVVRPETMIRWHRAGWKLFWRLKCRPGRPPIPRHIQALIRRMANENPAWGEQRIANEFLVKLGIRLSAYSG